jgi:putative ABC transport system permease protein
MVTPAILVRGVIFALVMGVLGGYFPARRAARIPVVQAIR